MRVKIKAGSLLAGHPDPPFSCAGSL